MTNGSKHWLRCVVVFAVALSVSACRVVAWGGDERDDDFGFFFSISSGSAGSAIPRINPGIDEGRFLLVWSVQGADEVWLRYYLSTDSQLGAASNENDLFIGESMCSVRGPGCQREVREYCQFTHSMTLLCGLGSPAQVSILFNQLPQRAYVIARACSLQQNESCADRAHLVEFF